MKIALVGPIDSPVVRAGKGGSEIWTYNFARTINNKQDMDITLFACKGSSYPGKQVSVCKYSDILDVRSGSLLRQKFALYSVNEMAEIVKRQAEFDVIHLSVCSFQYALPFVKLLSRPMIITFHCGLNLSKHDMKGIFYDFPQPMYVLPSKSITATWARPNQYTIIPHGIEIEDFSPNYNVNTNSHCFWMGRIVREKGVEDAIAVSKQIGKQLVIAGPVIDQPYFDNSIKPDISKRIKYVGRLGLKEKVRFYKQSRAFIFPTYFEEPFGLVVPEANACGTPVVAYSMGAMPELIKDGMNGYLVKPGDIEGMAKAVKKIYDMPEGEYRAMRKRCREHVEKNFTVEKMVDGYEEVYKMAIKDWKNKK